MLNLNFIILLQVAFLNTKLQGHIAVIFKTQKSCYKKVIHIKKYSHHQKESERERFFFDFQILTIKFAYWWC